MSAAYVGRIMALLSAWDNWSIYPPLYITGLEASFMRKSGDLEAKDLTGVEESSLDKEALAQKANQVTDLIRVVRNYRRIPRRKDT